MHTIIKYIRLPFTFWVERFAIEVYQWSNR